MDIYTKITITLLVISMITSLIMFPDSPIADWIEKRFGDYERALVIMGGIPLLLVLVVWLVYMWVEV